MTATVVPECTHWEPVYDVDCDAPAVAELTVPVGEYGARTEFACAEHLPAMEVTASNLRHLSIERCTVPAPESYECTRIPHATGPCALRPVAAAAQPLVTVPVPAKYRPSKWSTPWILLLGLIGYELWAVATSKPGGPLSHLVWWTYGERWSLRWWLCSSALNGLGLWAAAHFMFEWPEVKELLVTVVCAVGIGFVAWFVTR